MKLLQNQTTRKKKKKRRCVDYSSSVEEEAREIIEHEITNVIEEKSGTLRARSSQAAAMYGYNPSSSYVSQILSPPQVHSHPEQNITEKPHQPDWYIKFEHWGE